MQPYCFVCEDILRNISVLSAERACVQLKIPNRPVTFKKSLASMITFD
jgi:hypothetical protein